MHATMHYEHSKLYCVLQVRISYVGIERELGCV